MAVLLKGQGDTDGTKQLYAEVIEGQTAQLGALHLSTLRIKMKLVTLLANDDGELLRAKALTDEVVAGRTEQLGPEHASTANAKQWQTNIANKVSALA